MQSRRDILKLMATTSLLVGAAPIAHRLGQSRFVADALAGDGPATGTEYILLCDADSSAEVRSYTGQSHPGTIKRFDVAAGEVASIDVPLFGHIVNQNPFRPEQVVAFEKWGTLGALVDIKEQKLLTVIEARPNSTFFGHSVLFDGGRVIAATEQDLNGDRGALVLRSVPDMKVIGELASYGNGPHECRSHDHGKTIMVANSGRGKSAANVSWVDSASGKLLRKIEFPEQKILYSHLDVSFDGWVCVSGGHLSSDNSEVRRTMVAFISPNGHVSFPTMPTDIEEKLKEEALSIAFLGTSGLVAVTVPSSDLVLLMDYKKHLLIEALSFAAPKGIIPRVEGEKDPSFIVSLYHRRKLLSVGMQAGGHPVVNKVAAGFGGNGSHMTRIYV